MNPHGLANRTHPAITQQHLGRLAVVYVRQSSLQQVRDNTGSAAFQRSLAAVAKTYGWASPQIMILDEDLGKSGSSTDGRTGWQRLQELIDAGQVGAVFAANMSRLARQLSDFELFRLRAAYQDTLLYIDGAFLDPADANDAAVSQITAMVAQFENRKRTELMMQGRVAKGKRGEVMTKLPLGWIKGTDGQYEYDPAVKETITMIITIFRQTKSLALTVKQLEQGRVKIPYRHSRTGFRKITQERVRFILTHPAYGGTYTFKLPRAQSGGASLPAGSDAASACITKHDCLPPYMSREEQRELIVILESDNPKRKLRRGRCRTLIKGLLRCGTCGEPLEVIRPLKTHAFRCHRIVEHTGKQPCFVFMSDDLESCILREVFKVLKTPPIHMLKAALKASRGEKHLLTDRIEAERERLAQKERSAQERVELTLGGRPSVHFDALEKLEKVLQEKERFEKKSAVSMAALPKDEPKDDELDELSRIASEMPALWQSEVVTDEERKQILRHVIDHVLITATDQRINATIIWRAGGQTSVFVWRANHRHNLVRELHQQQLTPQEIKEQLAAGNTSTGQVVNLTVGRIQQILYRMGIKPLRHSAGYFLARQKAVELHRKGRSLVWIARHFNQRGIARADRRTWTAAMISHLLYTLGHQTEPLDELHYRLISEARSRGLSYRKIAVAFNKKKIRRLGVTTWTAGDVEKRWTILRNLSEEVSELRTEPIFKESA